MKNRHRSVESSGQIKVFRAFLRKVFNVARAEYDSDESAVLPHGGDVLKFEPFKVRQLFQAGEAKLVLHEIRECADALRTIYNF